MNEKLSAAIEVLEAQLEEQMQQISETKKTINSLLQRMGEEPRFSDVSIEQVAGSTGRRDAYYGKPLATAVQEYLKRRNQACTSDEIIRGLEQGGFDFRQLGWKEDDRVRSLSISLAKNSITFHRLPNGTFGLLGWYPEVEKPEPATAKKKARRNMRPKAKPGKPTEQSAPKETSKAQTVSSTG